MLNKIYWEKEVVTPIRGYISGIREINSFDIIKIEQILRLYCDEEAQEYILDSLNHEYQEYCWGRLDNPWLKNIMLKFMDYDAQHAKVIHSLNIINTTISWAEYNEDVRIWEFLRVLTIYDNSNPDIDWAPLEQHINGELRKLKVYGNQTKCGYFALLHGYIRIRRASGVNDKEAQDAKIKLLVSNWDFLKLVYSVMIGRICDNGNRDFAAIANNMRVLKTKHKYIHIFYAAMKERINDLCNTEEGKDKINNHLKKISEIEKETPQDYETLDGLCSIIFDELPHYLDKNKIKSYDEVMGELREMKDIVDSLNNQIEKMAQRMADAVNAAIPVEDIENELLRLQPGTGYDVYTQVNSLLIGNKAWMERANDIKHNILEKRDTPTIIKGNYYASGSNHDDKSRHIEIKKEDELQKLPKK